MSLFASARYQQLCPGDLVIGGPELAALVAGSFVLGVLVTCALSRWVFGTYRDELDVLIDTFNRSTAKCSPKPSDSSCVSS